MILIIIMLKTILQNCKNQRIDDETMKNFWSFNCLKSLIKQKACFKNPERSSCIDFILTSKPRCFQSTCVIETLASDFHRMTVPVLKMNFCKLPPDATESLKSLKIGLWIPYIWLSIVKILIALKIYTYFLIYATIKWIIMLPEKKDSHGNNKPFMIKFKSITERTHIFLENLTD